ncbi:MAG: transcription factor iiib subunit [Roseibium sp.]
MANSKKPICPSEATSYLKAVKNAGFQCGHLIAHPDGRMEIIGGDKPAVSIPTQSSLSPFEQWEIDNANTS